MTPADTLQSKPLRASPEPYFDLSTIDMGAMMLSRADLERWIPHRGVMMFLDGVIWYDPGFSRAVAVKHVTENEFWIDGHFPGRPMMPGVVMVEAGAQLASFLTRGRRGDDRLIGFTRIENAVFRGQVTPGCDLHLIVQEVQYKPRRFISDVQGWVGDRFIFESRIVGMTL